MKTNFWSTGISSLITLMMLNSSSAQDLKFSAGTSWGRYSNLDLTFSNRYGTANFGIYSDLGAEITYYKNFSASASLTFAQYGGTVHSSDGAMAAPGYRDTDSRVSVLGITITPIIVNIGTHLKIGAGTTIGAKIAHQFEGTDTQTTLEYDPNSGYYIQGSSTTELSANDVLANIYGYLNFSVEYSFSLSRLKIGPMYQFSLGYLNEIKTLELEKAASFRHVLGAQIRYPL